MPTLLVTNGDSSAAVIRAAGIEGEVLPWRDVLHDGPVPSGLSADALRAVRARHIVRQGWGDAEEIEAEFRARDTVLANAKSYDEVVLLFEHDLYDQLQLLQVLDALGGCDPMHGRLTMITPAEYLGTMQPERMRELFATRAPVSGAACSVARRGWASFRSNDPRAIEALLGTNTSALPYLAAALRRHLEEFPWVGDGLSRSERQALEAIASGRDTLADAFVASHQEREDPIFLGDASFASYIVALSRAPVPLLLLENGAPVQPPRRSHGPEYWERRVRLTATGRAILRGEEDHIRLNGIDRWLGGVHLKGNGVPWRWDPDDRRLTSTPA